MPSSAFDRQRQQFILGNAATGSQGPNGVGVPASGASGSILTKNSAADYDTAWLTRVDLAQSLNAIVICTSGTRPGSPTEGLHIYETDTNRLLYNDGGWIVLRDSGTFTPVLGNMVIGTGGSINTATFKFSDGILVVEGKIKFGTAGTTLPGASQETIALPTGYTMAFTDVIHELACKINYNDVSAGANFKGAMAPSTSSVLSIFVDAVSGTNIVNAALTAAVPFAWAISDEIYYRYVVEATGTP